MDVCEKLFSPTIVQPPHLSAMGSFLAGAPATQLPILPDEFSQLPRGLQHLFFPTHGFLARIFTNSIFPGPYGTVSGNSSEQMTVGASWRPPDHPACCPLLLPFISFSLAVRAVADGEHSRRAATAGPGPSGMLSGAWDGHAVTARPRCVQYRRHGA
jgi:hypothetical protein